MHYTAGGSAESAVNWLCNPAAQASAHLVIGRDGSITQLIEFNKYGWHAGVSRWQGREGLNRYSIGIELDNAGKLTRQGGGWAAWFGTVYDDSQVLQATHPKETGPAGWHIYTPEQIEVAAQVASVLVQTYQLLDVIGHEDINLQKVDPGPAFPMASFRARAMGRRDDQVTLFKATAALNIRSGPGTQYDPIRGSPLPVDTPVEILKTQGNWSFVAVKATIKKLNDLEGWVYNSYLIKA